MRLAGEHLGEAGAGWQLFEDRVAEYGEVGVLHCMWTSVQPSDPKEGQSRLAVSECASWTLYHAQGALLLSLSLIYFCCKAITQKLMLLISCPATVQGHTKNMHKIRNAAATTQVQSGPASRGYCKVRRQTKNSIE